MAVCKLAGVVLPGVESGSTSDLTVGSQHHPRLESFDLTQVAKVGQKNEKRTNKIKNVILRRGPEIL